MTTRETELLVANAALELEVAKLRSVLADVIKAHGYTGGTPIEAMSTPFAPTAIHDLIEKVEKMTIERCAAASEKDSAHAYEWVSDVIPGKAIAKEIRSLPTGQIKPEELL